MAPQGTEQKAARHRPEESQEESSEKRHERFEELKALILLLGQFFDHEKAKNPSSAGIRSAALIKMHEFWDEFQPECWNGKLGQYNDNGNLLDELELENWGRVKFEIIDSEQSKVTLSIKTHEEEGSLSFVPITESIAFVFPSKWINTLKEIDYTRIETRRVVYSPRDVIVDQMQVIIDGRMGISSIKRQQKDPVLNQEVRFLH